MGIKFDNKEKIFYLETCKTSYIMKIVRGKYLVQLHHGKKITSIDTGNSLIIEPKGFSACADVDYPELTLDFLKTEYPSYGNSDYRVPAISMTFSDGTRVCDLSYVEHEIIEGKPELEGLPSTYASEGDRVSTLNITMIDESVHLKVVMTYSVYEEYDAITKSVRIYNCGAEDMVIDKAMSMNAHFDTDEYEYLQLNGAWGRERHIQRTRLRNGIQSIESRRGASSHQNNPFMALLTPGATEEYGEVYGYSLVYSGNFIALAEVDQFHGTRVQIGINNHDFSWRLCSGESFQTPEAVMVYSDRGIGGMSQIYHKLYRERLCAGKYRDAVRPILINNWEGTYFDFTEEKITDIAREASLLGIELMVLDDGWFGKRNSDNNSLGDWVVNSDKLPHGLKGLSDTINGYGMEFGLWFEPEMVSEDSNLYREHSDWCIHIPYRKPCQCRWQLILDLTRREVCDYVIDSVSNILDSAHISYVKWDMNRHMTEFYSVKLPANRQKETAHRYMLGLYYILDKITKRYPDILFESCSGGGGRFDPGMLRYMPQTWTSDDTDAVERLKIQYGTSIVYPVSSMGAHVSAVPNHQMGRNTSLKMRGDVAMSGNFGYELDITEMTEQEKEEIKNQVALYKKLRQFVGKSIMYRLKSPFEGNDTAWMYVSEDKEKVFFAYFKSFGEPNVSGRRVRLRGLKEGAIYRDCDSGKEYSAEELMNLGLYINDSWNDFTSYTYVFEMIK